MLRKKNEIESDIEEALTDCKVLLHLTENNSINKTEFIRKIKEIGLRLERIQENVSIN